VRWLLRHDRAVAAVALALAVLVYLAPLVAGRRMGHGYLLFDFDPWHAQRPAAIDVGGGTPNLDLAVQNYPLSELARHQLDDGSLPLWNPSSYAGTPLFADMQSALLYPLTWLALVMPFSVALGWICALKLLIAAFGTYLLARYISIRAGPAFVSALIYAFSAPVIAWVETPLGSVVTLLPWLLLATERARREGTPRAAAGVAAVVALSLFAGHPETAALSSAAAGVYLAAALAADPARRLLRTVAAWAGGHLLGLGVAAVLLVPFLAALGGSVTDEVHSGHAALHLPVSSALVLFLPNVFGEGTDYHGPLAFYISTAGYFGVGALLLAAAGAWRRRGEPFVWGLAAAATVALMVIFDVPPVSWVVPHLPPFSGTLNVRVFYVVALAAALLAGAGLDALVARPLALRRLALAAAALLAVVAAWYLVEHLRGALEASAATERAALAKFAAFLALGTLVVGLAGRVPARYAMAAAAVVVVADLAYMHDFNPLLPAAQAYPKEPPVVRFLASRAGPFRVGPIKPTAGARATLPPNTPALYGLEALQGYDYPQSARWSRFAAAALGERGVPTAEFPALAYARPVGPARAAMRLMNVRYYVARPGAPPPGPGLARVYSRRDASVYEDRTALPRAFLVGATTRMSDRAALATLARGGLDPRRRALVPRDAPKPAAAARGFTPLSAHRVDPGHWRIEVPPRTARSKSPRLKGSDPLSRGGLGFGGWLVLANAYRDDWRARVDGREVRLYPTDYAAMGLPLPRGARTVDIELDRSDLHAGALVSAVSLLATLGLALTALVRSRRRRRRRANPAGPPPRAAPG
jgi:hypothetical protein